MSINPTIIALEEAVANVKENVIEWRRHFHANPELSWKEFKTAQYIEDTLHSFGGLKISRPTPTSVLAKLKGANPGPIIGFRADIDALPIMEETGFEFQSTIEGLSHACGHDSHAAMLLGAAKILAPYKEKINGEIYFIFQHAEEVPPGGAKEIMTTNVLDPLDMIFALHVLPMVPTCTFVTKPGVMSAASDRITITVQGKGGHASMPHMSIDPVVIGVEIVQALQTIVARRVDPTITQVLSVTQFNTGNNAINVIPDKVTIGASIRSFDPEVRDQIPTWFEDIVKGITYAHGATYSINIIKGHAPVVNNAEATQHAVNVVNEYFNEGIMKVLDKPYAFSEDFSGYTEKIPGCYIGLGIRNEEIGSTFANHHPKFKIDEDALEYGVKFFVMAAAKKLLNL